MPRSITLFYICLFAAIWCLSLPLACAVGPVSISLKDLTAVFAHMLMPDTFAAPDQTSVTIVQNLRLARGCIALICGGVLACAGVALQGTLHNSLADPFTLGISAGAACGASLAIAFFGKYIVFSSLTQTGAITMAAMAGALCAMFSALYLGRAKGAFGRENIILAGIAVAAFLGSIVALVKALNEDSITSIVFWIMGSLQGRGWECMPMLLGASMPGFLLLFSGWRKLDILAFGDEQAAQLGLNPGKARFWLLAGASCMAAGCVSICGIIGFVGLVAPHILRLLLGPAHGPLLVASFFVGGIFLLLADCIARSVLDGGMELPVGIVTALTGAPFFAFLIHRRG